ncbi:MAG: hypothetical protein JWL86_4098 [Rhizobium sp.]|nr:hypothetical protein [Rhizobium sp.]
MRLGIFLVFALFLAAGAAVADSTPRKTFYVRYAINMDFLPPLIGEMRCERGKPCDIVKLQHFNVVLTSSLNKKGGKSDTIAIDCKWRQCAVEGRRSLAVKKKTPYVGLDVTDRMDDSVLQKLVLRKRNQIGEILLAY